MDRGHRIWHGRDPRGPPPVPPRYPFVFAQRDPARCGSVLPPTRGAAARTRRGKRGGVDAAPAAAPGQGRLQSREFDLRDKCRDRDISAVRRARRPLPAHGPARGDRGGDRGGHPELAAHQCGRMASRRASSRSCQARRFRNRRFILQHVSRPGNRDGPIDQARGDLAAVGACGNDGRWLSHLRQRSPEAREPRGPVRIHAAPSSDPGHRSRHRDPPPAGPGDVPRRSRRGRLSAHGRRAGSVRGSRR